jgi:iron complex transport system substrate-binding protein
MTRRASLTILLTSALCLLPSAFLSRSRAQAPPAPRRIISLVPAVTEMLFAIGDGDAVVGVSSYDHYPAAVETRVRVGALVDPDFERIISLKPDLIVVYGTQADLITRLDRAHLPMFRYAHAGLADITSTIRAIGLRVGRADAANAEADRIEGELAAIRRRVSQEPRPKTLLVFGREAGALRGIYASAGIGFLHDMLDVAGGDDVFGDVKRQSVQASTEQILARAPEVILEIRSEAGFTEAQADEQMKVWRTLPAIPAVKTNRLIMLTGAMLSIPGPRVAEATLAIAKALHPKAFQ